VKLEAVRVLDAIRSLPYQRNGICGVCGKPAWVARSSGRHPWRCAECVQRRLERRKSV
jgi:hypothetical protein